MEIYFLYIISLLNFVLLITFFFYFNQFFYQRNQFKNFNKNFNQFYKDLNLFYDLKEKILKILKKNTRKLDKIAEKKNDFFLKNIKSQSPPPYNFNQLEKKHVISQISKEKHKEEQEERNHLNNIDEARKSSLNYIKNFLEDNFNPKGLPKKEKQSIQKKQNNPSLQYNNEVAKLVYQGKSDIEISKQLNLSLEEIRLIQFLKNFNLKSKIE